MMTEKHSRLKLLYHLFTRWYPDRFKSDYLDEMEEVFQQRLDQAARQGAWQAFLALLSEVIDIPGIIFRSKKSESYVGRGADMQQANGITPGTNDSRLPVNRPQPSTWEIFIGLIPFLISPVITILLLVFKPVGPQVNQLNLSQIGNLVGNFLLVIVLAVMAILVVSWRKGFPVWSFPYWGFLIVWTLFTTMAATPGLSLFGIPLFGGEIWGIRAWVPLILVLLIGIALTRSLDPVKKLIATIRSDWTTISYAFYIPLPFIIWILFDEMHGVDLFVTLMQLVLAGGALVYLLSRSQLQRISALLGGLVLSWLPSGFYLWNYWDGRVVEYLPQPIDGSGNLVGITIFMLVISIILVSPGILARLFRHKQHNGGMKNPPAAA